MGKGTKHIDQPSTEIETCPRIIPTPYSSSSSNPNRQVSDTCKNGDFGLSGIFPPSVFARVPSVSEVEFAISVLRNFIQAVNSHGSGSNWLVDMLDGPAARIFVSCVLTRVYRAFQLLEMDPSFKRLVVSLATDKNIWNAILKNVSVQKLREPKCSAENGGRLRTLEEPELAATILQKIWEMSKAKVMELIENFQALMNDMFQSREMKKGNDARNDDDQLDDKVKSSLLLTVIILLIVVFARTYGL